MINLCAPNRCESCGQSVPEPDPRERALELAALWRNGKSAQVYEILHAERATDTPFFLATATYIELARWEEREPRGRIIPDPESFLRALGSPVTWRVAAREARLAEAAEVGRG